MSKVLSSYRGQISNGPPVPWSSESILFLDDKGGISRWAMGESGWLCALPEKDRQESILALGKAGTPACAALAMEASQMETLWVGGRTPQGAPIGLHRGTLRLPQSEGYYDFGWLDPEGTFYPCGYFEHDSMAKALAEHGVKELEKTWVRISDGEACNGRVANDAQCEFLMRHEIKGAFNE